MSCSTYNYAIDCNNRTIVWRKIDPDSGLDLEVITLLRATAVVEEYPEKGAIDIIAFNEKHHREVISLYEDTTYAGVTASAGTPKAVALECGESYTETQEYADLLLAVTNCLDICNCP